MLAIFGVKGENMVDTASIDEKDRALLRALQRDGRSSVTALADRVALSESACRRRLDHLERTGVIAGYRADLDGARLGFSLTVFVSISLGAQTDRDLTAFEIAVRSAPEVLECWLMTGDADYLLRVAARYVADLERIHREVLTRLPSVVRVNTAIAMRAVSSPRGLPL
jgi:Lrp/AsnC family transcriptional regulator, leucine-responsive regulatory protein